MSIKLKERNQEEKNNQNEFAKFGKLQQKNTNKSKQNKTKACSWFIAFCLGAVVVVAVFIMLWFVVVFLSLSPYWWWVIVMFPCGCCCRTTTMSYMFHGTIHSFTESQPLETGTMHGPRIDLNVAEGTGRSLVTLSALTLKERTNGYRGLLGDIVPFATSFIHTW